MSGGLQCAKMLKTDFVECIYPRIPYTFTSSLAHSFTHSLTYTHWGVTDKNSPRIY